MKFLYVARERQAAERAALALRTIGPDVALSWAGGLGQARRWIDENHNATALIVEVDSDTRSFEALITHARGVGVKVPVIGIPLISTSDVLLSVGAVADAVVQGNGALLDELPQAVKRTLNLTTPSDQISIPPSDGLLQRQLRDAEAAATHAEQRAQAALDQLRAREESTQAALEQERAVRVGVERRLAEAESARQNAEAALRRESALTENLSGAPSKIQSLEQELAEAKRILRLADQLHATTKTDAEARIRDIQEETEARLAEAASDASALQRELADTVVALRSLEQRAEQQATADRQAAAEQVAKQAERDLAQRKAIQALETTRQDLDARLVAARNDYRQLEKQHASAIAAARAAMEIAEQRAVQQQTDAAAAARELETRLAESVTHADRLRVQLSEAALALTNAEQQAAADRQAAAEQVARQQATFDSTLAQEVLRREKLESQQAESDLAHRNAIEALEATRQDLDARLVGAHDAHRQLEAQHASAIAAAGGALEAAEQRASQQQTEAVAAAHALEARLAESEANADRLRAQLSEGALARANAEQQAAADRQAAAEQVAKQQATFDSALAQEVIRRRKLESQQGERDLAHRNAIEALEAIRQDLDARLVAAHDTHRQLEAQHASAIAAAGVALEAAEQRASQQQTEAAAAAHALEARLAQSEATADRLRVQVSEAASALAHAEWQAAADRETAAEQIIRQQAVFDSAHAERDLAHRNAVEALEATRHDLDAQLATARDAHRQLEAQHASAIAAAGAALEAAEHRASQQQTEAAAAAHALEARLAQSEATADRLRVQVSEAASALAHAEWQAAADRETAAEQIIRQQAVFDSAHAERDLAHRKAIEALEVTRQDLDARLVAAYDAHRQLEEQHDSAIAVARAALETAEQRASQQQTDAAAAAHALETRLAESEANAQRLRAQLSDTASALAHAKQQVAADRQAAAEQAAKQAERDLAHRNAIEALEATRQDLDAQLVTAHNAHRQREEQHASAIAAARAALETAELRADQQLADAVAAAHALETKLAESVTNADRLRAQLSETALALTSAKQQATVDRQAAAEQAAKQQAERDLAHRNAIEALEATREDLDARLVAARDALRQREEQHASAIATARAALETAEQRASQQQTDAAAAAHALEIRLAESEANADHLGVQLRETVSALTNAKQHRAEYEKNVEAARLQTEQGHAAALAAGEALFAAFKSDTDSKLAEAATVTDTLRRELSETAAALTRAEQQATSDRQSAAEDATRRRAEFDALLGREVADRKALEARLAHDTAAWKLVEQQHASAINHAAVRLAEHQQQADAQAAQAASALKALQTKLVEQAATLLETERQANADRQAAAEQGAERQARFETELAQEVARRQNLAARLTEAEAALKTLEIKLADTTDALQGAVTQAANDRQTASEHAARQQAEFEASLAREIANTQAARNQLRVQQQQADIRLAEHKLSADARLAEATANAAATLEASLQRAAADRQAAADRLSRHQHQAETRHAQLAEAIKTLEIKLADTTGALQSALTQAANDRQTAAEQAATQHAEYEASLAREIANTQAVAKRLTEAEQQAEAQLAEAGARAAKLEAQLTEQRRNAEAALVDHRQRTERQIAELQKQADVRLAEATTKAAATLAAALQQAAAERRSAADQFAQQQATLEASRTQEVTRRQAVEQRVAALGREIAETRAEYQLRFDQTPIGMWRSRRDGTIVQANQALVSLLRYKTVDELRDVNFSSTVFESADELQWLVDRCLASRATETIETTWRRHDGVGIVVRLMAMATSSDAVDFVAIDITMLRALEEKLRNSQRMESVARYASEVAVTCNKLLGQVNQQGQQWLTRIESESARHQGALLLDDVTRAVGFLNQLTLYGKEQKNTPELVEVKQVLRDLEPVLTRVAGSRVELVMPKTSSPYNLDVEIERFERILVNVAAYGRERMPYGGRLMIDVSAVVVDRTFVEKYPNVRPGAHVLLTVTEKKGATGPDWSMTVREQAAGGNGSTPTQKPGVDLGALQALVSDCGGHLWILAEPSGNLELRIHLPRRELDDRAPAKKAARGGWMSKLAGARNRESV